MREALGGSQEEGRAGGCNGEIGLEMRVLIVREGIRMSRG